MINAIIGFVFLIISVFLAFKLIGNLIKTIFIALLLLLSYYLIFGYLPQTDKIDLKGFFGISIQTVGKDSDQNLLLYVKNNWFFAAKNISVSVDGKKVDIINNVTEIPGMGKSIIQVGWNGNFDYIVLESKIGTAKYKK
ncbi:MAG: hypothetical protein N3D75_02275 [Candidatus Aenigmarchaeota archaeon]|nr:hypothetical protein [Candidatus Aenigmarchaeota archaeon]